MDLKGKKISVIGAARSGLSAALLIKNHGGIPFVSDIQDPEKISGQIEFLSKNKIDFEAGLNSSNIYNCDFMVVSPGVPLNSISIATAFAKGIKVISEIELGYLFCKGKILAVTGTNGKTTTTSLLYHILKVAGKETYLAGNIGTPLCDFVNNISGDGIVALELSSFQLDTIEKFRPNASTILNITPDHLNRYDYKIENYIKSKYRIVENARSGDLLVLNSDDTIMRENPLSTEANVKYFSCKSKPESGAFFENGKIHFVENGKTEFVGETSGLKLKGKHNFQNIMAASILARSIDLSYETIFNAVATFEAVEHRLEPVPSKDGIIYINDSKATNVDSVFYALQSFDAPLFLILGGQDKGNDYNSILDLVKKNVKKIYAIGSSATKIIEFFSPFVKVESKNSLRECVLAGHTEAKKGEIVLLSPACASFDMFLNYEDRGLKFKEAVTEVAT
ncbi:MAG: UDP-N-acetylmuramoyl-L-alanine--D-glutamate ligase [Ignavibacteriaceae bacterium]|nr:UDP-N-acetylmuramoyl-L-alanine--D-glutamate ligase [Ignavibacteriaceae bacterium]